MTVTNILPQTAGVFPGIVYYLGGFFPRTFVSHSIGLFFSAGVIAGVSWQIRFFGPSFTF